MLFKIVLLFCFWKLSSAVLFLDSSGSIDLTLIPNSAGEDVVDACTQKLNSVPAIAAALTNDFGLLKRIALVETNFGRNQTSGGIWQINFNILIALNNGNFPSSVSSLVLLISDHFGQESVNFMTLDFSVPFRSAIAARIFFEIQVVSPATTFGSLQEQGNWWSTLYNNNGLSSFFVATVQSFENANTCIVQRLDLFFLIDGSGSIDSSDFDTSLDFAAQAASTFTIASDRVRTGLAIYDHSITFRSFLNRHTSIATFTSVALNSPYPGGGTQTGAAIDTIATSGFTVANGARLLNEGVPRILVVLTDGQSGDDVSQPAQAIRNMGVNVLAVGVGSGIVRDEINEIASDPDSQNAFEFNDFNSLLTILVNRIHELSCDISAPLPTSSNVVLIVDPNSPYYSQVELPVGGFVMLTYDLPLNSQPGVVYISETVQNPSPAFHNASFQISPGNNQAIYISSRNLSPGSTQPLYTAVQLPNGTLAVVNFVAVTNSTRISIPSTTVATNVTNTTTAPTTTAPTTTTTANSIGPVPIVDIPSSGGSLELGIIIAIVVAAIVFLVIAIIVIFCILKALKAKHLKTYAMTEVKPDEEVLHVENELNSFIVASNSLEKVDVKFVKDFENAITAAELLSIPASQIHEAQIAHMSSTGKLNEVNKLKNDMQAVLRDGEVSQISSTFASAKILENLDKWTINDPELKLLLDKSQAAISLSSGTGAELAVKQQEARQGLISILDDASSKRFDYRLSTFNFDKSLPKLITDRNVEDIILLDNAKSVMQDKSKLELQKDLSKAFVKNDSTALATALESIDYAVEDGSLFIIDPELQTKISQAQATLTKLEAAEDAKRKILKLDQPLIDELKSPNVPPKAIDSVMKATLILLGEKAENLQNWKSIQSQIGQSGKNSLKKRVFDCAPKKITMEQARKANSCIKNLTMSEVGMKSKIAGKFLDWNESMLRAVDDRNRKIGTLPKVVQNGKTLDSAHLDKIAMDDFEKSLIPPISPYFSA